ncbi:uncharacterized protein [Epargyreus clarus]|uniref:uncharacterized protein n=1 Tax=Epargyreus clarus TaxID=520877 RepID=UPI003C2CA9B6
MALVPSILCALLMFAVLCCGKPHNKVTVQDLLNIIANSDNPGEDLKSVFDVNKIHFGSDNNDLRGKSTPAHSRPANQVTTSTTTPKIALLDLNHSIRPTSSGYVAGQNFNHNSAKGHQSSLITRPDFGGLLNYGLGNAVGAAQTTAIQSGQIIQHTHVADCQLKGIQGAHATEAAARTGQANAIHNAQVLDAARTGNIQRAQAATLEYARAAEAARLAAASTMAQVARAQEAGRIANAANLQAERIANAARVNLAVAASRAAGPVQLSSIANSATLAIQAARETEAVARSGQANAMRNAQALDAVRVGNVHRAQAAVWENTRAAESARQAAAGTAAELERAAEAERIAYAARVRANAIANLAAAQASVARNAQESALFYGGYGSGY